MFVLHALKQDPQFPESWDTASYLEDPVPLFSCSVRPILISAEPHEHDPNQKHPRRRTKQAQGDQARQYPGIGPSLAGFRTAGHLAAR